jgi:hypothetical protein
VTDPQLAADEPLSPELVLVLPPALRAQALARLGPPAWPVPRSRVPEPEPMAAEPDGKGLLGLIASRVAVLALAFAAVTVVTLVMSFVAHAVR